MQTSSINGSRDLDLFYDMLQERARAIRINVKNKINWEFFWNLPSDVTINILSRLPIRSIMDCKDVCKAWRDLIESPEFSSYQPDHRRCLIAFPGTKSFQTSKPAERVSPAPYRVEKLNGSPMDIVHIGISDSVPLVRCSVNGLLLLLRHHRTEQQQQKQLLLWVCNPITREYVIVPNPSVTDFQLGLPPKRRGYFFNPVKSAQGRPLGPPPEYTNYNFGFGVSRKGKQYKVVWITQSECRVYTLGLGGATGQWRNIAISRPGLLRYNKWNTECAFVDGNLYWLDPPESKTQTEISCFDLETEVFTYFSAPASTLPHRHFRSLCAFDGCLCLCDMYDNGIDVWLMRGRDWSKKVVFDQEVGLNELPSFYGSLFPIKDAGNRNGMLLGVGCDAAIYCYYSNSNSNSNSNDNGGGVGTTCLMLYPLGDWHHISSLQYPFAAIYIPSFLSLRTLFADEDVHLF